MLPINIKKLLNDHIIESERIEFKKGWNPQVILRSICAFANDFNNIGGGYIIVGVEETDGIASMPPVGIDVGKIDAIQKELLQICHYISPNYFPIVEPTLIQEKYILVIWCPPGDVRPYKAPISLSDKDKHSKVYYIRHTSSSIIAKDHEEQRLLELTAKVTFDNRVNQHQSIDDLSLTHIASFLKEVNSSLYTELSKISLADLCRNMGIARGAEEELKPLNIGLLMFSDDPSIYYRGAQIDLVEYQDDIGDQFRETLFKGPVWQQLKDVLRYIRHTTVKEQVIKIEGKAEADRFYNYPYEALEEAIANAVFHKGYDRQNPIEINIRHDCIEILSFPGPVPPVDNESLKKDRVIARDYRNSRLGDFLKELHLTEGRSTGIPKIRRYMKNNGSPEPIFETDANNAYFLTTLQLHKDYIQEQATGLGGKSRQESRQESRLESELAKRVIKYLSQGEAAKLELAKALGHKSISGELNKQVKELLTMQIIERTLPEKPNSRLQKYRLTPKGINLLTKL